MAQYALQPRLLLVGRIDFAKQAWSEVEDSFEVITYSSGSREDFIAKCRDGTFDGITALCRSNQFNYITGNFDAELVQNLPTSLEAVCNIGAGVNTIDVKACQSRGLAVSNTPAVGKDAVADATILLLLGALRRAVGPVKACRAGRWQQDTAVGQDAQGRTLGLYGFGSIASAVAARAKAFGMTVKYFKPSAARNGGYHTPDEHLEAGYKCVSFEELITTSDIISIHSPLNKDNWHAFSKPQFDKMKKGVVIVNTARGGLIDQDALIDAVMREHVWAVGLDVFEAEPEIPEIIRRDDRFFIMPHVATKTAGARTEMEKCMIKNLIAVMTGNPVPDSIKSN